MKRIEKAKRIRKILLQKEERFNWKKKRKEDKTGGKEKERKHELKKRKRNRTKDE